MTPPYQYQLSDMLISHEHLGTVRLEMQFWKPGSLPAGWSIPFQMSMPVEEMLYRLEEGVVKMREYLALPPKAP